MIEDVDSTSPEEELLLWSERGMAGRKNVCEATSVAGAWTVDFVVRGFRLIGKHSAAFL